MRSRTGRGHSGNSSMPSCEPDFGIYVHWPFCKAKCPYCDFNSHVRHGGVDAIAGLWPVEPGAEITLEANPTSVEAQNFAGYRVAGVNRVSVGVQTLNDGDLKALDDQVPGPARDLDRLP